ncbi:MAG: hypothetical protein C5B44_05290 [Acidobacteria bacterium]|nr:MAG: hypothetical protein C5B44_05290 [Acidobacteriota bacterium]
MDVCSEQHLICLDLGTTYSRVWLLCGDEVVARSIRPVGVRLVATEGSTRRIVTAVRDLVADVRSQAGDTHQPKCIAAAGMITSELGLKEIPHVVAPAGLKEIVSGSQWHHLDEISDLPFLMVPGVRTTLNNSPEDVMRGEETLCLGLISSGALTIPGVVMNLGSHWKAIKVDSSGRISKSVTSLSGELIDAARTQTVLASSLPKEFLCKLTWKWVEAGMTECRQAGLPRALFRIRLLEIGKEGTAEERLAFLAGAFIAADLDALVARGFLEDKQVVLSGRPGIADCWRRALQEISVQAYVLSTNDTERVFLIGLQQIVNGVQSRKEAQEAQMSIG